LVPPFSGAQAALLLLLLFTEYRCFGINRKGNAADGNTDAFYSEDARMGGASIRGLDDAVYRTLLEHPDYRVALLDGPVATDFRFYGLATPQGFDPFLTQAYKNYVERFTTFISNREFDLDAANKAALDGFGVGFVMALRESEQAEALSANPAYELLPPGTSFFQVFWLREAKPAWRFAGGYGNVVTWRAEERQFEVASEHGGEFVLLEQWFPGWRAYVDQREVAVQKAEGVFQQIAVPPGRHAVAFAYRPWSVAVGGAISALALAGLFVSVNWPRRRTVTVVEAESSGEPVSVLPQT
jgi:hypothetical protein